MKRLLPVLMGITSTFVGGVSSVMNSLPKHSKPSKLISMRILFATLCLTLINIGGCSSQRENLSTSELIEVWKSFERGEIRQNCETSCSGSWGESRSDLRKAHDRGAWRELASRTLEIGYHGWLSYYYLGRAAEGLGKYKAAEIYYEFAKSGAYKSLSIVLSGFTFPRDINHRLMVLARQKIDDREKEKITQKHTQSQSKPKPKQVAKRPSPKKTPSPKSGTTGSGFFVSKLGHIITNEHVVRRCSSITVGDSTKKQVTVTLVEADKRNDLALLKISSTQMASVETKSLIRKLGIKVVPLATDGLMRAEDVELGEDVLVAGYPYGEVFSNTIKVTKGIVSANRGLGDDTGQFQIDAAVQPGNSGGPIYDENGNIVGVVVAQLNKRKFEKIVGSIPENVNFGIKASTVRQFLNASGLPTKWSKRSKSMSTRELAKIAKSQTVMVVCHR